MFMYRIKIIDFFLYISFVLNILVFGRTSVLFNYYIIILYIINTYIFMLIFKITSVLIEWVLCDKITQNQLILMYKLIKLTATYLY